MITVLNLTGRSGEVTKVLRVAPCRWLLHRRGGLSFGAFDFGLTGDGIPVFLECNPNGQWGWLEDATGLPIAAAIAALLLEDST
ncbi:hypothetical protein [Streptosporangium roseum]|uniref:hypothetical protein n=1 Tax=Streptosporangium roseum TaxID=2001 RepID=UPI000693FFDD|nr:hypothetical protein [Streptosporangium roseum]